MKIKGLEEYLQDDADLMKKITYQEYQDKMAAPRNSDHPLEEAYEEYCAVISQEEEHA